MKKVGILLFNLILFLSEFFTYLKWWIINVWAVYIQFKNGPRIFSGWWHYKFACKYADKRAYLTSKNKLFGNKRHYVLPYGKERLIVVNREKIKVLKEKQIFKKNLNIVDLIKHSYYATK